MIKKVASILLALFFLVSSSHLSFATHYCDGKAFNHTLLLSTSDLDCCLEDGDDHISSTIIVNNDCCSIQSFLISIKDEFLQLTSTYCLEQQFIIIIAPTNFRNIFASELVLSFYYNYKPPMQNKDIPVLIQSFLI